MCLALALLAAGCGGSSTFPSRLLTVDAPDAEYPVMLSRTTAPEPGRAIAAMSGTSGEIVSSTKTGRQGEIYHTSRSISTRSEMSAAEKLAAKVKRSERWVQLEQANFESVDETMPAAFSYGRSLTLKGRAHQ